jgi:sec-independent protein translocase protein TatA
MGIHWTELIVVAFVALLIFGPKRLPEIGGAVGRTYREFRKSLGEVSELATNDLTSAERRLPAVTSVREAGATERTIRTDMQSHT